jgi:hypothetical protein
MLSESVISYEDAENVMFQLIGYYGVDAFNRKFEVVDRDQMIANIQDVLSGLSENQIFLGLEKKRDNTWCPNLPELRAWCTGSSKFTDVNTAYVNAANEKYPDAATYEAASRTGMYELRTRAESSTKPVFKKHYEAVCAELEINPHAFRLPAAQRIEQAPANVVKKDAAFFENLRKGSAV